MYVWLIVPNPVLITGHQVVAYVNCESTRIHVRVVQYIRIEMKTLLDTQSSRIIFYLLFSMLQYVKWETYPHLYTRVYT